MTIQQSFCSARDLEEVGVASKDIKVIALAQRKRAIRTASGLLSPYLRKRNKLPLAPRIDDEEFDISGLAGGGTATFSAGPAVHARDIAIVIQCPATFANVGDPGVTYTIDIDNGAYGSAPSAAFPFPLTGILNIDGYVITFTGGLATNDTLTYSTRIDSGAAAAVAQVAAYLLVGSKGIDPVTRETLKTQYEGALAWAKDVSKGDGDLEPDADATPNLEEAGPRYTGQTSPWQFLGRRFGSRGGYCD